MSRTVSWKSDASKKALRSRQEMDERKGGSRLHGDLLEVVSKIQESSKQGPQWMHIWERYQTEITDWEFVEEERSEIQREAREMAVTDLWSTWKRAGETLASQLIIQKQDLIHTQKSFQQRSSKEAWEQKEHEVWMQQDHVITDLLRELGSMGTYKSHPHYHTETSMHTTPHRHGYSLYPFLLRKSVPSPLHKHTVPLINTELTHIIRCKIDQCSW